MTKLAETINNSKPSVKNVERDRTVIKHFEASLLIERLHQNVLPNRDKALFTVLNVKKRFNFNVTLSRCAEKCFVSVCNAK